MSYNTAQAALDAAKKYRAELKAQGEAIATDGDLTFEARSERLAALWAEGEAELRELLAMYQDGTANDKRTLKRDLYAPPSTNAERVTSFRDALARAVAVTSVQDTAPLREMLEVAELTGDEDQAHACFVAAHRGGVPEVVQRYLQDRPEKAREYQESLAAERQVLNDAMTVGFYFTVPDRPQIKVGPAWKDGRLDGPVDAMAARRAGIAHGAG